MGVGESYGLRVIRADTGANGHVCNHRSAKDVGLEAALGDRGGRELRTRGQSGLILGRMVMCVISDQPRTWVSRRVWAIGVGQGSYISKENGGRCWVKSG